MPVVELETIGRHSGKRRTTMVAAPTRDGDAIVVVAAYHGDDRNPAWYLNLRDNPDVHVTERGERRAMRARTATGDEHELLWTKVVSANDIYAKTQAKTSRQFPVVVLDPA
jgi:deazaflavin-dependent oxidoreductase (nitroreductase family)